MDVDTRINALEIIVMAQGQVIETLMGVVFAGLPPAFADEVKGDLRKNAEKFVTGYTGGPIDVRYLQADARLLQAQVDRLISRSESVEQGVRLQVDQHPAR